MTGPFRPPTGGPAGFPGQGGQQQPHPTVGNAGMPGAPVTIDRSWQNGQGQQPPVQQFNQPADQGQGQWQMPPAPQPQNQTFPQNQPNQQFQQPNQQQPPQPHPTVPYGQPGGQQQPPMQQQGQPGVQRADIPDNLILDGPSVPTELRGRSWGQVKQIYGALANDFLLRQNGQGQQQPQNRQPAPQGQQQRPGQPPVYTQGEGRGNQAPSFWENPEEVITRIVDSRVAPITQRTTAMAIQEAKQVAAMGIPDFQYLEAEILQVMAGAAPEAMADPRLWQSTADLARGRMMSRGEYDPRMLQAGRQQQNGQPNPAQVRGPGGYVPAPVSPMGQFFTEAPTPPQFNQFGGYGSGMSNSISQEEHNYAVKMNMTDAEYVAWRGGVQPTAPVRRY